MNRFHIEKDRQRRYLQDHEGVVMYKILNIGPGLCTYLSFREQLIDDGSWSCSNSLQIQVHHGMA